MRDEVRDLRDASDIDEGVLRDAEAVWEGWFADKSRIDWVAFLDRLSDHFGPHADRPYEFLDYDSPAVRKVQRYVRGLIA